MRYGNGRSCPYLIQIADKQFSNLIGLNLTIGLEPLRFYIMKDAS